MQTVAEFVRELEGIAPFHSTPILFTDGREVNCFISEDTQCIYIEPVD